MLSNDLYSLPNMYFGRVIKMKARNFEREIYVYGTHGENFKNEYQVVTQMHGADKFHKNSCLVNRSVYFLLPLKSEIHSVLVLWAVSWYDKIIWSQFSGMLILSSFLLESRLQISCVFIVNTQGSQVLCDVRHKNVCKPTKTRNILVHKPEA